MSEVGGSVRHEWQWRCHLLQGFVMVSPVGCGWSQMYVTFLVWTKFGCLYRSSCLSWPGGQRVVRCRSWKFAGPFWRSLWLWLMLNKWRWQIKMRRTRLVRMSWNISHWSIVGGTWCVVPPYIFELFIFLADLFGWLLQQLSCGSPLLQASEDCEGLAGEAHHEDQCFYV